MGRRGLAVHQGLLLRGAAGHFALGADGSVADGTADHRRHVEHRAQLHAPPREGQHRPGMMVGDGVHVEPAM